MQRAKKEEKKKKEEEDNKTEELLAYYKGRIENFDQERSTLLEAVDRCSVTAAEIHRLEWESRKRADEVRELQKALSDAHAFLFEERQRLLTLQAENDELRLQEIEDRKRIQQLLGAQPGGRGAQQAAGGLAHYSTDALLLKIESLQAQLNEQKQLAAERIAALLEDRRIREAEEEAHRGQLNSQLEGLAERLRKAEEGLRQTTKDYILARRDKQAAEEKALTAEAALQQERLRTADDLAQLKRRADKELRDARAHADAKLDDITTALRKQLKAKEDELVSLTAVHSAAKSAYDKRLAELEERSTKLASTNKALEGRRAMDMEGFAADLSALRKMLTAVDRKLHEMRLVERLGDDDRLDTILDTLRKKTPALPGPLPSSQGGRGGGPDVNTGGSDASSVKGELAVGLKEIRGQLRGLEDRLAAKKRAG